LWVINGDETWATPFSDEDRPDQPAHRINEIARDGPTWGTGISVDVVVEVSTGADDFYLLAANQIIHRTD